MESELLDTSTTESLMPTSTLVLIGVSIITATHSMVFLGSVFFIIIPLFTYFFLLFKYKEAIFYQGLKHRMFIGGIWLALPSIPLMTFLMVTGGGRFFNPNFTESFFLALILAFLFFIAGAFIGFVLSPFIKKQVSWKTVLYSLLVLLVLYTISYIQQMLLQ